MAGPGWASPGDAAALELDQRPASTCPLRAATGSTARGGASGQCQPQPYGINFNLILAPHQVVWYQQQSNWSCGKREPEALFPPFLGPRGPLGTPLSVIMFDCVKSRYQLYSSKNHQRINCKCVFVFICCVGLHCLFICLTHSYSNFSCI